MSCWEYNSGTKRTNLRTMVRIAEKHNFGSHSSVRIGCLSFFGSPTWFVSHGSRTIFMVRTTSKEPRGSPISCHPLHAVYQRVSLIPPLVRFFGKKKGWLSGQNFFSKVFLSKKISGASRRKKEGGLSTVKLSDISCLSWKFGHYMFQ